MQARCDVHHHLGHDFIVERTRIEISAVFDEFINFRKVRIYFQEIFNVSSPSSTYAVVMMARTRSLEALILHQDFGASKPL